MKLRSYALPLQIQTSKIILVIFWRWVWGMFLADQLGSFWLGQIFTVFHYSDFSLFTSGNPPVFVWFLSLFQPIWEHFLKPKSRFLSSGLSFSPHLGQEAQPRGQAEVLFTHHTHRPAQSLGTCSLTQTQRAHPAFSKANNIPSHKAGYLLVLSKCESELCPCWQQAQYKVSLLC